MPNVFNYGNLVNIIENEAAGLHYSKEDVADFFILYVSGTPIRESARTVGIKETTAKRWRSRPWWSIFEAAARKVASQAADRKLSKTLDLAIKNLTDRLKDGDPYTVQGEVRFKPVSAKDTAIAMGVIYDKRALIRGEATTISAEAKTEEERLKELSEAFEEISTGKPILKVVSGKE